MSNYIIFSIAGGILFAILDGVINANPLAQKLFAVYQPIAKKSINFVTGIAIDLVYGFVMAGIFLLLYDSFPSANGVVKGIMYALVVWFFRVVMYAASQWMMFTIPIKTLLYTIITGLTEMLIMGVLYGLTIRPLS